MVDDMDLEQTEVAEATPIQKEVVVEEPVKGLMARG